MDTQADSFYSCTGYDVASYFQSAFIDVRKTAENAASDDFASNFSGAAFCQPYQMEGILFIATRHNQIIYPPSGIY